MQRNWVRIVVSAAVCNRAQPPVSFDEFQDGNVVRILVRDISTPSIWRNNNHRNPGAIAKIIERLHITGVIIAAAFVEGDDDRRIPP